MAMYVVRPAREEDVDQLYGLIQKATYGLSTLKISKDHLETRIEKSIYSFGQKNARAEGQPYVFVMESTQDGSIVGTSAIYSKVGGFEPFYSYEIKSERKVSKDVDLNVNVDIEVPYLSLRKQHDGPTEIGSLYLSRDCWGQGLGRLLSLSRFLFIAQFPERFDEEIIAELRGVVNEHGESPLWNALGSHFFQQSYPRVDELTSKSKKFIAELMPENEIYIPLLPKSAQEVIGRVHKNTRPALELLKQEGFEYRNIVDIFDGGPAVHCKTNEVRCVKQSLLCEIKSIRENIDGPEMMISNTGLDFRVTLGKVEFLENDQVAIDEVTALRLDLITGGQLRCVGQKPEN